MRIRGTKTMTVPADVAEALTGKEISIDDKNFLVYPAKNDRGTEPCGGTYRHMLLLPLKREGL